MQSAKSDLLSDVIWMLMFAQLLGIEQHRSVSVNFCAHFIYYTTQLPGHGKIRFADKTDGFADLAFFLGET